MFIVFEGIDGAGKTSVSNLLAEKIRDKNKNNVFLECEPTNNIIGSLIRDVLSGKKFVSSETLAALFHADRLEHIYDHEIGLLKILSDKKNIVICDRFELSNHAYSGQNLYSVKNILKPDITIFLNISIETALNRISQNRNNIDIFENRTKLQKTLDNYSMIINEYKISDNIHIFDAELPIDELVEIIFKQIEKELEK